MTQERTAPGEASSAPEISKLTTASGLTFDVRSWGPADGVPLIALHGFPQGAVTWTGFAHALSGSEVRVVAFDQRGYSPGARPPLDNYNIAGYVQDVIDVADALELDRFHLIGFGMGGLQTWATAAAHPSRVASMTSLVFPHPAAFAHAINTNPEQAEAWHRLENMSPPEPAARAMLADSASGFREFLRGSGMPEANVEETVERVGNEETLAPAIAWHLVPVDDMASVGNVTVPALYLWSYSPALIRSTSESTGRWVSGPYRSVELPEVGHWVLETAPDVLSAPVLEQLRRTGGTS